MTVGRTGVTITASAVAALAGRYATARRGADRTWAARVAPRLRDLGEVDDVTILPLVERLTGTGRAGAGALRGEPGLSYLIRAGDVRLLFDAGLNLRRGSRSLLLDNASVLGVEPLSVDAVVISHLHADHVGGARAMRRRTFDLSPDPAETPRVPAFVPTDMRHPRAEVVRTTAPHVVAPGVAVLPPLPAVLFALGPVSEQALVINVRGFGLVVVTGCGHPPMERILGVAEEVLDVPIRAVVGGMHLPVHPLGTPLLPQALLGNPHWPWQPIGERDAMEVIEQIRARGPRVVAVSGHDSTPWTFRAFEQAFGDGYRTLRVGEELRIPPA
jgi:7,8-dihydropterin-6-yl-methyl-4-(beta-D-ribofuranosyl)aminobenzene 5'-phosphate synthase